MDVDEDNSNENDSTTSNNESTSNRNSEGMQVRSVDSKKKRKAEINTFDSSSADVTEIVKKSR